MKDLKFKISFECVCERENKRNRLYVLSKLFIFGLSDLQSRWLNNFQASYKRLNPLCLQVRTYSYSIPRSTLGLLRDASVGLWAAHREFMCPGYLATGAFPGSSA